MAEQVDKKWAERTAQSRLRQGQFTCASGTNDPDIEEVQAKRLAIESPQAQSVVSSVDKEWHLVQKDDLEKRRGVAGTDYDAPRKAETRTQKKVQDAGC